MAKLLPTVTKYIQKANSFIDGIAGNPAKMQQIQTGFESLAGGIANVGELAFKVFEITSKNWPIIEPMIWGIVGAIAAWRAITFGMMVYQGIMAGIRAGTIATTFAQWGLNAAVLANPMTWIVLGVAAAIGVLIAGIILLRKNWDVVSNFMVGMWENIKNAFAKGINWIVDKLNWLIEKANILPGVNIPLIPKVQTSEGMKAYANGGFANQPAIFGEAGLEAAIPIRYKNPRSLSLLNQTAKAIGAEKTRSSDGVTVVYSPNIYGGKSAEIESILKQDKESFFQMLEEWYAEKERVSFA
jgi:hypothetical protein